MLRLRGFQHDHPQQTFAAEKGIGEQTQQPGRDFEQESSGHSMIQACILGVPRYQILSIITQKFSNMDMSNSLVLPSDCFIHGDNHFGIIVFNRQQGAEFSLPNAMMRKGNFDLLGFQEIPDSLRR